MAGYNKPVSIKKGEIILSHTKILAIANDLSLLHKLEAIKNSIDMENLNQQLFFLIDNAVEEKIKLNLQALKQKINEARNF